MSAVLFVSNGHGEAAIADRIAQEIETLAPSVRVDHLSLVGESRSAYMNDVGPSRAMPSGGLIAMGNVANIARDIRGGLIGLTLAQRRFLKASRAAYARVVAVGDVYALLMALAPGVPVTYVGTAKSVNVAEYGPFERSMLKRASAIFVRDEATAQRLTAQGVDASAPGNVMVDLWSGRDTPQADRAIEDFVPPIAVFPGSREHAYEDAAFALEVVRRCVESHPRLGAVVSLAPMLDVSVFAKRFEADGWTVDVSGDERMPFVLRTGDRTVARAWRGPIGPLITRVALVLGQAGTANEAAASAGVPIVAFERTYDRKTSWYRMRQHGLLGDALLVLQGDVDTLARGVTSLLDDPARRVAMGHAGRQRMGAAGGARAIARSIADALT